MSQLCRLISWSMAFHSSGLRQLNSSPTAENKLLFTAFATCGKAWYLHKVLPLRHEDIQPRSDGKLHTHPVEAGFSAELVGSCRAEVIVGPEGLVKCCDEVEQSLPATLVTQGVLSVLAALPQPRKGGKKINLTCSIINVEVLRHPGVTHSEGLAALLDWGGESASKTCGSPSWQNCLNICLSSPAILQE